MRPKRERDPHQEDPVLLFRVGNARRSAATPTTRDRPYFVSDNKPLISCLDIKTGRPLFDAKRIEDVESVYASPFAAGGGAAGGRIYLPARNGPTVVLNDADRLEVLATNTLDDGFDASPAVAGDTLLLRGHKWLYCIGEK